jgi:hypothetical protein
MTMTWRFRTAPLSLALALWFVSVWALGGSLTSAVPQHRRAADFDWEIVPHKDPPTVNFTNASLNSELIFAYDIPTLNENKTYSAVLYQNDCTTLGADDSSLLLQANASVNGDLVVRVIVNQTTVSKSAYWSEINQTTVLLSFCIRVDLYLHNESINFHETNVSIAIDMTAGSDLTAWKPISAEEHSYSDSRADYPLTTYYCDDKNQVVFVDELYLTDGGTLQFCVEIDPSLKETMYVREVQRTSLDQQMSTGSKANHADIVSDSNPDPFTSVKCSSGICNIVHQLSSQWFAEGSDVVTTGVALISFGSPSVFTDEAGDTPALRRHLSLAPHLVPLYGYDGPNLTVVNRTTNHVPNTTTVSGTFTFRTSVAPNIATSGPSAFQEGVKIAAYVAAGLAGAAIAALVAAKAFAASAVAASGGSGTANDVLCGGEGTDSQEEEEEGDEKKYKEGAVEQLKDEEEAGLNDAEDEENLQDEENAQDEEEGQDEMNSEEDRDFHAEDDVEDEGDVQVDEDVENQENVRADEGVEDQENDEDEGVEDQENDEDEENVDTKADGSSAGSVREEEAVTGDELV